MNEILIKCIFYILAIRFYSQINKLLTSNFKIMKKIVIIYNDTPSCSFTFKNETFACEFLNSIMNGSCERDDITQINIINVNIC